MIAAGWLVLASTLAVGVGTVGAAAATMTFTHDGQYEAPVGVTELVVTVTGAGGGSSSIGQTASTNPTSLPVPGGAGAQLTATIAVHPGESLQIVVGRAGHDGSTPAQGPDQGGDGGAGLGAGGRGGDATGGSASAGGGGGGSAILDGTTPLVVAGGGGGGSGALVVILGSPLNYIGGDCNFVRPPATAWMTCPVAQPPTTTASPLGGWGPTCVGLAPGVAPTTLCAIGSSPSGSPHGADGVDASNSATSANPSGGGGGGATGGGGGVAAATSPSAGGGAGGSSTVDAARVSGVEASTAANAGRDGIVSITPIEGGSPTPAPTASVSLPAVAVEATHITAPAQPITAQPTYTG